jgi:universal stress protein A
MTAMHSSLRKILVPTDNSEYSAYALKIALNFAEKDGSTVHLLHVIHTSFLTEAYKRAVHLSGGDPHTYERNLIEENRKETDDFVKKYAGDRTGITVEVEIRKGEPVREIIDAVKEKGIDLLVIGTHGRKGLAHAVMGSVAEKVVREATCPVLTVNHKVFASTAA